ncbi:MAG: O-antigen ligase [Kiloniellaceae bacterium]
MTPPIRFLAAGHDGLDRPALVLTLFALLVAPVGLLADKAVVPLVLAAVVAAGAFALRAAPAGARPWQRLDRGVAAALAALMGWALVSCLWSPQPLDAAGLAIRVTLLLLALLLLAGLVRLLDGPRRRRVALALALGVALTAGIVAIEFAFGAPLFTLLRGPAKSDYVTYSQLNRGVSAVAILIWPVAALAWARGPRWAALALPPAVFVLTLFSQSSASKAALGLALLAAVLAAAGRRASRIVLVAALAGTLFGSLLAAPLAQRAGLTDGDFLQQTGAYRLHIWGVVGELIGERPLFGWGFDASRDLPTEGFEPFRPGRKVIPSHPHNGALQIMVELGLVGSLLTFALGLVLARRIEALPDGARPFAVGMTVAVLGIAATAYGIWQSHWLTIIGAAAALFIASLPPPAATSRESRPSSG